MVGRYTTTTGFHHSPVANFDRVGIHTDWLVDCGMAHTSRCLLGSVEMPEIKQTLDNWVSKKLWNIAWDMWDYQNEAMHNLESYHNDILDSQINNQVRATYSNGLQAVPWDVFRMFRDSLETLLMKPPQYTGHWVASVQADRRQKQWHNHGVYQSEQQGMQWWLGLEN